jgi:hypothetical protein
LDVFSPPSTTNSATQTGSIAPATSQSTPGTGTSSQGPANLFQQLSSDIQAILVQGQSSTASPTAATSSTASTAPATSATSGTTSGNPAQAVATDLQSLFAMFQNNQPGTTSSAQPGEAGQVQPHHHHHHHGGGAPPIASSSDSSATTASSSTAATGTAPSSSVQGASQSFAADIMQVLQAYSGKGSPTMVFGMTA